MSCNVTVSVITATYNAGSQLPALIGSLNAQTDRDFEWVVADGASNDKTLELVARAGAQLRVRVDSRPDTGIYDALNRAIRLATGEYYIVVGADDTLAPDAIAQYRTYCASSSADLVTALVSINGVARGTRSPRWIWLCGMYAFISGHAVGVAIRRSLHERVGFYDQRFALVADQLFVVSAVRGGANVVSAPFVAGTYSTAGASGTDSRRRALEKYRMQRLLGSSIWLQLPLFGWRMAKWYLHDTRQATRRLRASQSS